MNTEDDIRVSVTMIVYNGERFIRPQIDSIINMMGPKDELVISYDKSTDKTWEIINEYQDQDKRIKVFVNPNERGVWSNSLNCLKHAKGKYIFSSDQDDLWVDNKIENMVGVLESTGAVLALHNGYICDGDLQTQPLTIFERYGTSTSKLRNFIKNTYFGCCMCYRADVAKIIFGAPHIPESADQFSGIAFSLCGKVIFIDKCLIKHRVHGGNVTPTEARPIITRLKGRLILFADLLSLIRPSGSIRRLKQKILNENNSKVKNSIGPFIDSKSIT